MQNVFKSKSFHELSDTALATLLTSDRIEIDELDVITAVREWATVNAVRIKTSVGVMRVFYIVSPSICVNDEVTGQDEHVDVERRGCIVVSTSAWHAAGRGSIHCSDQALCLSEETLKSVGPF